MKLNEKIIILRKREGLSQEDLANKLDISRQAVYKWESDSTTPDLNNIKKMAQIFNISFNQLLDDSIDIKAVPLNNSQLSVTKKVNNPNIKREVFRSNIEIYENPADYDHGYLEGTRGKVSGSFDHFSSRREKMKQNIKSINSEFMDLVGDSATAFFYNNVRGFFGLYYNGAIQFLCPYENYISCTVTNSGGGTMRTNQSVVGVGFNGRGIDSIGFGSIPQNIQRSPYYYKISISYFDNNMPREILLHFCAQPSYYIYELGGDASIMTSDANSNHTAQNLERIKGFLDSIPTILDKMGEQFANRIINLDVIKARLNESIKNENSYKVSRTVERDNIAVKSDFKLAGWIIFLVAAIAIFIIILVIYLANAK